MNSAHNIKSIQSLFKEELKSIYPQREIEKYKLPSSRTLTKLLKN